MASFLENLWLSIFTPGPTPTLLLATNASFAALQLLLFTLLIATHSIHFVILSLLTAGLWYAINWFSAEIMAAQKAEDESKRLRREKDGKKGDKGSGDDGDREDGGDDTEGVETEVERENEKKIREIKEDIAKSAAASAKRSAKPESQSTVFVEKPSHAEMAGEGREGREATPSASASGAKLAPASAGDAMKKRRNLGESTGDLSTDSEWEKLSQDSGENR